MTLRRALCQEFGVNNEFCGAILSKYGFGADGDTDRTLEEFRKDVGAGWKQISYALGTNQRAESSLQRMLSLGRPERNGSALDVGCGYGGFLRAFSRRGFRAVGVDIDGGLAGLARINIDGTEGEYEVHVGDLFAEGLKLGAFDLITVNDVIEHLADPVSAFNKLAEMVAPGGVLAIYAPNGQSVFNVTADPHNGVLGSSAMPGPLAKSYVQARLRSSGYSLGEYFGLGHFRDLAARNGLEFSFRCHDGGERPEKAVDYLAGLIERYRLERPEQLGQPILARAVEAEVWRYISEYAAAAAESVRATAYTEFNDRYLARAWTIMCRRGSAR